MLQKLNYNLNWSEYFQTDAASESGLVRIRNRYSELVNPCTAGSKIFRANGNPKTWHLHFKENVYLVHRIIWVLSYGSIDPIFVIDHLDGDPFNNKIANLALKTQRENSLNKKQHKNNVTGVTGVSLDDKGEGYIYYKAHWRELDGSAKFKCFSVAKLGQETAKALAIAYREQQVQRLILEGANYTERHGTK